MIDNPQDGDESASEGEGAAPATPPAGPPPTGAPPAGGPPAGGPPPYPSPPPGGPPPYPGSAAPPAYPTSPPGDAPPPAPGYPPPPGYSPPPGSAPPPPSGSAYPPPPPGYYQGGAAPGWTGQEGGPPLATYGARLGGWLIDWVILLVVGAIISGILNSAKVARITFHTTNNTPNGVTTTHFSVLAPIIQVLIVLLYGAFLCGSERGQTVGMMAVGVRAVDRDGGKAIGFWRALGRAAFEYLLFILLFIPWVIDMLFPAWDAKRQTLHDKVTRTVVVRAR